MIMPSKWQQTFSISHSEVIGQTDTDGKSTFYHKDNKDRLDVARLELAYGWNEKYQSGVSLKYQNRNRDFHGNEASASGWSDVGLSHAYKIPFFNKAWIYQTLNLPTSKSTYESDAPMAVNAQGSGTYISSVGAFYIQNFAFWDWTLNTEIHRSFARTFKKEEETTEVGSSWGGSIGLGVGYIPWRSKIRYGLGMTPRFEGPKTVTINNQEARSENSLVWDTSLNLSYTISAQYALGLNYVDQTIMGPARNTNLTRSLGLVFQSKWL